MRDRLLRLLVSEALHHRRRVLLVAAALTLLTAGLSERLTMNFQWTHLLPDSMPVVQEYRRVESRFANPGNFIVVLEDEDRATLEKATDTVIAELKKHPRWVRLVQGRLPERWMIEQGLRAQKPADTERAVDRLSDPRLVPFIEHLNDDLEAEYTGDSEKLKSDERMMVGALDAVQELIEAIAATATGSIDDERLGRIVRDLTTGNPYFFSVDRKMTMVMAAATFSMDEYDKVPPMDRELEAALAPIAARFEGLRIRRTGLIPIGRAEMESVGPQTMGLTLLALVLVFLLLRWNFGDWWAPVLAMVPLAPGVIWSMGVYAVTVRSLNLMTVMIMLVLIGLGIDFSIHLLSRFREERNRGASLDDALLFAVAGTGRGVVTGATTTAAAFLATMVSASRGTSEFGFCAGVGVLVTLGAVLYTLPALVAWHEERLTSGGKTFKSPEFQAFGSMAVSLVRGRAVVLALGLLVIAAGVVASRRVPFEYNFMNLEPRVDAVKLQTELIERYKMSPEMSSVTVDSIAEARSLSRAFRGKAVVGGVDSISEWIPDPRWQGANDRQVARLRREIAKVRSATDMGGAERAALAEQLDRLLANVMELEELSFIGGQDRVLAKLESLSGGKARGGPLPKLVARVKGRRGPTRGLQAFADRFASTMRARIARMARRAGPLGEETLPPALLARYKSRSTGRYLVQIAPRRFVYDKEALEAFNSVAVKINPRVTGTPQLIIAMNDQMVGEGRITILAATLAIFGLLLLDFRRLLPAVLAMLPLGAGVAWMLLAMWAIGMKYNFINLIAIPIMIGIGVDDGVHFLHRYLEAGKDKLRPAAASVGRAIGMTSLTTMIGFGNIGLYDHPGMAGMGIVLFIGVAACLLATLLLMPPLADLFSRWLFKEGPSAASPAKGG